MQIVRAPFMSAIVALILLIPSVASAQRRSSGRTRSSGKGVPCGHSYISADKTCRIDSAPTVDTSARRLADSSHAASSLASPSIISPAVSQAPVVIVQPPFQVVGDSLRRWVRLRIALRNAPIDDKWLRNTMLTSVGPESFGLLADDGHSVQIRLDAVVLWYPDPEVSGTLVVVLRR